MAVRETLALSRLKSFEPLRRLSDEQLVVLLGRAERRTFKPGQRLIERGALDGREFFLLDGALEVVAEDGRQTTVIAGTEMAAAAIARQRPRRFDVTAIQPSECLIIEQTALHRLLQSAPLAPPEEAGSSDPDMDDEHRLLMAVYNSFCTK